GLKQPPNRTARAEEQAIELAHEIGYPLVVRPSYVLGGRAMEIVHGDKDLQRYMREAVKVSAKSPVLLDRFLDDAIEVDVDCIADGSDRDDGTMIGGIMEHVEQAGIHSGDSACSLPPYSLSKELQDELRRQTVLMARAVVVARELHRMGFAIVATKGTAAAIAEGGVPVKAVNKVKDGRPHIVDMVKAGEIQLVFTTVDETRTAIADSRHIRQAALANRITYYTSMAGCEAAVEGMKHQSDLVVVSLQELHSELRAELH